MEEEGEEEQGEGLCSDVGLLGGKFCRGIMVEGDGKESGTIQYLTMWKDGNAEEEVKGKATTEA